TRRLETDLGERPRRPDDASRQLEIDEEAVEAEQWPAIRFRQPEILDLELEQQGVDPDLAHLPAPLALLGDLTGPLPGDESRDEEEPGQRVDEEEHREHGQGDDDRPAPEKHAQPCRPLSRSPRYHGKGIVRLSERDFNRPPCSRAYDANRPQERLLSS